MANSNIRRKKKKARRKKRVDKKKILNRVKEERQKNSIVFRIDEYDKSIVSKDFVSAITKELQNIRLDDRQLFTKGEELFYKAGMEAGFKQAFDMMIQSIPGDSKNSTFTHLTTKIGQTIYKKLLDRGILLSYIPFNDANITPSGKEFIVTFDALLKRKTNWGTVHYSPLKPKINVDGQEYIVAFSKHAVERICERTVGYWETYNGSGDCFAYLKKCKKYDLLTMEHGNNEQQFITFYETCAPNFASYTYLEKVIDNIEPGKSYCYRVGYCPLGFQDGFACSKTLLTPGMSGTPENHLIKNSNLDNAHERKLRNAVQDVISKKQWVATGNLEAIKWFHDNGIPQVLEVRDELFED
ncbi:MAG: hypothetical protein ABIK27_01235 [Bacteroidota bacterium]